MKKVFCLLPIFCFLLSSCGRAGNVIITHIDNYLPKQVHSLFDVSDYKDGKFYYLRDMLFCELDIVGVKYIVSTMSSDSQRGIVKIKGEDKYVLEKGKKYHIHPYVVTHDKERDVDVLHSFNFRVNQIEVDHTFVAPESFIMQESENSHTFFIANDVGTFSLKLKVNDFEFEPIIEIVDSIKTRRRYNIDYIVDSSFLGTSSKRSTFKKGSSIKINLAYDPSNPIPDCGGYNLSDEIVTFNGIEVPFRVVRTGEIALPSIDLEVEYYHYPHIPEAVSYASIL